MVAVLVVIVIAVVAGGRRRRHLRPDLTGVRGGDATLLEPTAAPRRSSPHRPHSSRASRRGRRATLAAAVDEALAPVEVETPVPRSRRARGAGQAALPRSAGQGPRAARGLRRLGPVAGQDRRRDLGRARGGADPGRRGRRPDHRAARRAARPGRRPTGSPTATQLLDALKDELEVPARRVRPRRCTSPTRHRRVAVRRRQRRRQDHHHRQARQARDRRRPHGGHGRRRHVPGRGRRAARACGPSASAPTSCAAPRAATRARSSSTPSSAAAATGADLVLADTAGRLHTKVNLMEELRKVRRVAERGPGTVTEVLLVLDATTGQNGLVQARQFTEAVEVTGVVLTKLDGSAKGGIVLAIQAELGHPGEAGRARRDGRRPRRLRRRRVRRRPVRLSGSLHRRVGTRAA